MSEAILKALIQMFAIIADQDGGIEEMELHYVESFLTQQLGAEAAQDYIIDFKKQVGLIDDGTGERKRNKFVGLTPVKMSVKILGLCRKINKTINQKQKVVVLVRLFELLNTSRKFTEQRMAIVNTVGEVFNISPEEFKDIQTFVVDNNDIHKLDTEAILAISDVEYNFKAAKEIKSDGLDCDIYILRIISSELYFLRYTGTHEVYLNGQVIFSDRIYLFAAGSTIKMPKGKPVYYSDVVATFQSDKTFANLSFNVTELEYKFPGGGIGLRNINFSECQGRLVGIMGASGAGKTTLLNVLSGITSPSQGSVKINGIDLHCQKDKLEGVIGLIPQDDLLIEELTVFENLYYNAKFCFKEKSEEEITTLVDDVLKNLGLFERKDLKVGNPFNKLISGGQRKRLNIALELIREPSVLFVDEPTSGLSSRDSENVMDLLSELTLKGKLIFVVIHQPSSEIYKMFDKMIILDTGGYLVYYGNPIEAISYFKSIDGQVNAEVGECPVCGNATPEIIFDILESRMVDEFGRYQTERKITPVKWEDYYHNAISTGNVALEQISDQENDPPRNLNVPGWIKQFCIYFTRDFKSKISNLQYVILNLTEAPLLGFILAFLIRYVAPNKGEYIFFENENIVPYIFMSIVVALFLGLTVSAEEIFRDRKILKREEFLNLSRSSYLIAKVCILTFISAIQALLYVVVGNSILEVRDMYFEYWLVLFSMFVIANMMGLNISSAFNSAVTIYILIPLLMIPQMALGGSMFSFDKLNNLLGSVGKVPIIAEIMSSRWSYEALMIKQFRDNEFENEYYDFDKKYNYSHFKQAYYLDELKKALSDAESCLDSIAEPEDDYNIDQIKRTMDYNLDLIREEAIVEMRRVPEVKLDCVDKLFSNKFNDEVVSEVDSYYRELDSYYSKIFSAADSEIQARIQHYDNKKPGYYNWKRDQYHNDKLQDIVKNVFEKKKIIRYQNRLIQQIEPIFLDADNSNYFGFRSHFYAPNKWFMGRYYDSFYFNICVIWIMSIFLYFVLYFDFVKKFVNFFGNVNFGKFFAKFRKEKTMEVSVVEQPVKPERKVIRAKTESETDAVSENE